MVAIKTDRLILRPWQAEDLEPFVDLNQDPRVMEYFPQTLSREESEMFIKVKSEHINMHGWGLLAASLIDTGEFIGFIGLQYVPFEAHFTPAVEIGWRLSFKHWGKGYATEGALASLKYGFNALGLEEIVSFTTLENKRSMAVMERISMRRDLDGDFDHPKIEDHKIRKCLLYRIKKNELMV